MKTICLFLLISLTVGCGYSSNGSGTVAAGAPSISSLAPNSMAMGGAAFTLTVNGSGFVNGAAVYWHGTTRTTTFVSASQLTAAITAADIATAQTVPVFVKNPGGTGIYMNQGGQSSASVSFTITP
jgi:IPT/TIG domain-containing protein